MELSLAYIVSTFGGSFITGLLIGIFLRMVTKWILALIGLELLILTILSNMGIITVNWDALEIVLIQMFTTVEGWLTSLGLGTSFFTGMVIGYLVKGYVKNVQYIRKRRYLR